MEIIFSTNDSYQITALVAFLTDTEKSLTDYENNTEINAQLGNIKQQNIYQ